MGGSRAIGWLGTSARTLAGLVLVALGIGILSGGGWIAWWQLALGLLGLPAVLTVAQLVRLSFTKRQLSQTNHVAFCFNCAVLIALLVVSATHDATLVFLGASMLFAALRGYGGCESLSISNWLLRRNDQVGCLLFSPVDRLEARRASRST